MSDDDAENSVSDEPTHDYDVGYRKPPKHTRFKPGQSGNPRGRPRGTKNLKTDLAEELGEKIEIREGERSRKVSKQRALIKSQTNKAIKGDTRAAAFLGSMMMRLLDTGEGEEEVEEIFTEGERDILGAFQERMRRRVEQETQSKTADREEGTEAS
jgi:hypothetical protein